MTSLVFVIALSTASLARADVRCNNGDATVIGTIRPGDFQSLVKCLGKFIKNGSPLRSRPYWGTPIGWVAFQSEGGDVNEAIKIGRFLRQGLAEAVVLERCHSACFLAVVGAVEIFAGSFFGGTIGVHRFSNAAADVRETSIIDYERYYNGVRDGTWQYLRELDVPTVLIEEMFSTPSADYIS